MEDAKDSPSVDKASEENPDLNTPVGGESGSAEGPASPPPSRAPFASLSQVDADRALARTLQEQERAYMMLRMNGSNYASSEEGSYVYEDELDEGSAEGSEYGEDALQANDRAFEPTDFEDEGSAEGSEYGGDSLQANDRAFEPSDFEDDEAYARALQDAEELEVAVHLMALSRVNDWEVEDLGDHDDNSQDAWQDVDPDELSYEELVALGEVVGTESRGLSADTIASLPSANYTTQSIQDGNSDSCVICRLDYEDGDSLVVLSCKHTYHTECINKWLQMNKVCPVCNAEVSSPGSSQD